jgi:hypothetical protein
LARFWLGLFPVWLGFLGLARFFLFGLGWVRFSFFGFAYKTETESASFFKILIGLIGFFYGSIFSVICFWFSRFNWFFDFFTHPWHRV